VGYLKIILVKGEARIALLYHCLDPGVSAVAKLPAISNALGCSGPWAD
jgi:hypothetical protein